MREKIAQSPALRSFVIVSALILPIISLALVSLFGTGLEASSQQEQEIPFETLEARAPSPFQQSLGVQQDVAQADDEVAVLGESTSQDSVDEGDEEAVATTLEDDDEEDEDEGEVVAVPDEDETEVDDEEVDETEPSDDDDEVLIVPTDPVVPVCDPQDLVDWEDLFDETVAFYANARAEELLRHDEATAEIDKLLIAGLREEFQDQLAAETALNNATLASIASGLAADTEALELTRPEECTADLAPAIRSGDLPSRIQDLAR